MRFTKYLFVPASLISLIGLLSTGCKKDSSQSDGGGLPASCNGVLFDNGNTAACTNLTDTSVFTLAAMSTVTAVNLWVNTTVSGPSLSYALFGATGSMISSGAMTKGACDPYQTNWCQFSAGLNTILPAGTYTVKSTAVATCSNSGSNLVGFVMVNGCAGSSGTPDAACAFGGGRYGGCADAPAASTCDQELFNNGNTAACTTLADSSTFTLTATSTVTYIRLWENTTISGQSVSYQLLSSSGTVLSSGPTTKGGCDPYQTNWCEFLVNMNMTLPAGSYTVKSSAKAICANSGSNNLGQVIVKGCAGGATTKLDAGAPTCNSKLFDNGNTGACTTPTDTSVFTLSTASTVTAIHLWVNTTISGQSLSYTLTGATGTALSSGAMVKGSCDPYQTNWCDFVANLNMTLVAGTYTVKSSAKATCSNSGSNSIGFVSVMGCAGGTTTLDAGCAYGGGKYGVGCADAPASSTCNTTLFDNGNIAACTTLVNSSSFTLTSTSTVTYIRLWENTTVSGQSVTYQLLSSSGTLLSSGATTKGGCDPYQTNWCEFLVNMNMTLPAGTYTVKSSATAICANSGSNNLGQVIVKGCAGSSSPPDGGARLDGGVTCQESFLFKMESLQGVSYNPPVPTTFTLPSASYITRIMTYHYSATIGSKSPTISFKNTSTSAISGPWSQVGYKSFNGTLGATRSDPGNVAGPPDNYWMAYPGQTVPAGTYQVIDSEPTTWAYTSELGNRGVTWVFGCSVGGSSATPDGGATDSKAICVGEGEVCTQLGASAVPCCSSLYCKSASSTATTGTCQRSEIAEAGTCGTQTVAGGDEGLTQSFNLGKVPADFTFRWNTYSIPDRVVVFYGGSILYDSGCTGEDLGNAGTGSKSLQISGAGSTVTVNVSPNCTGNTTGTAWDFTVDCPK